jgi:hypothetical protein
MRVILAALGALLLLNLPANACPGQTGKVIFEDTFTDDSGGWQLGAPDSEIKDGMLLMRPNPRGPSETSTSLYSGIAAFSAIEGDYCAEFILPKAPAQDNDVAAGVTFWANAANIGKSSQMYSFKVFSDGTTLLSRYSGGTWATILNQKSTLKTEPDAVNSLRVVAKSGKLTLYVDDTQIKVIRAQVPEGELHFGVFVQTEKAGDANPVVKFKSFKVTSGD